MRCRTLILVVSLVFVAPCAIAQAPKPIAGDFDSLLHQAFDLHQRNDYAHALPLLHQARKFKPHDYFVNLLLGIDLLRTGEGGNAVPFLREAARTRPQEEFPHEYLGEAEAGLKHFADAEEGYAQAIRVAPQSSQATLGYVDFSLARFGELSAGLRASTPGLAAEYRLQALAHPLADTERLHLLQRSQELDGEAPGIWTELALAQAARGSLEEAEHSLERASNQNANELRTWEAEALLSAQKGDWKSVEQQLNAISRRSPIVLADTIHEWPSSLAPDRSTEISGAAAVFLDCLAAHCSPEKLQEKLSSSRPAGQSESDGNFAKPSSPAAWLQRGIVLAHSHDCEKAIPALERGLHQDAQVYGMFLLSWCYARQANAVAERVQQSGEDEARIHMMRGDVLLRLQANSRGAITEYRAGLANHNNDPAILQRLAEAQLAAGQVDAARESAQAALKIDSNRLAAMRTLAKIAMEERNYEVALPYLRRLTANDPSDIGTRVELGTACAQTGALDEALQNLGPALRNGYPDEKGSLHYLLGTILRKLGRTSEANQAFASARELSDSFQSRSRRDESRVQQ